MTGNKIEYEFVKAFNNKKLSDLTIRQQCFVKDIFQNINYDDKIIAWKNKEIKKADIYIKIKNITRGISIKSGNENSVHSEYITPFMSFLKEINIPPNIREIYYKYHYGIVNENDTSKRYNAKELKEIMKEDLTELNNYFNKPQNIIKAIDRFIVHGIEAKYSISALISGTPENFTWLKSEDIYNIALKYDKKKYTAPHFGMLILQPKKRDLDNKHTYETDKNRVQVKWHNLYEEILNYYHSK
ncbi:MAG: hypothetical protein IJ193_02820 [Bacilli bacterium]|nr:hypothetical protein [Bacilli bacterium]